MEKTIINKITGQKLTFLRSDEDILEIESSWTGAGKEPPAHYHPFQEEVFSIIKGKLSMRINSTIHEYVAGQIITIPKGTIHSMWNNGREEVIANWKVIPAMKTEEVLRTFFGLANDDKTNKDGVPGVFQVALTARKYSSEIRLAKPSHIILNLIFLILSPIAYLTGHRATDKKYIS